jgi:hypothetical protein
MLASAVEGLPKKLQMSSQIRMSSIYDGVSLKRLTDVLVTKFIGWWPALNLPCHLCNYSV